MRVILLLFIFLAFGAAAQTEYHFNNYTINDGLSQSVVTCIEQDASGLLWIGTQDGLNRFDGREFEVFSADDTKGLESSYIRCSARSGKDVLWFGTQNGLTSYDPEQERFVTYSPFKNLPFQIEDIAIGNEGELYLATLNYGIRRFNPATKRFDKLSGKAASLHATHIFSTDHELIVSTEDKSVYCLDHAGNLLRELRLPSRGKTDVFRIRRLEDKRIGFGTGEGLFSYDQATGEVVREFSELNAVYGFMNVSDFFRDERGNWFISTLKNGLFTITETGYIYHSTEDIFQKSTLLNNEINCLFADRSKVCWIGSQRGLSSFDPVHKGFAGVGPSGNLSLGLPSANVWSFAEDSAASYLFVGTDLGVSRFNRNTGIFDHFLRKTKGSNDQVLDETSVLALEWLSNQKLLVGCADGLFILDITDPRHYRYEPFRFRNLENPENYSRTYAIVRYQGNRYFIGTKGGVLLLDVNTGNTEVFKHDYKTPSATISPGICRMIYRDKKGTFWFATSVGGLNRLTEQNGALKIIPADALNTAIFSKSRDYIYSMYQRNDSEYWLGTFGSGLLKLNVKTREVRQFRKSDGLPNNVIYSVLPDDNGNLWLSTNKGLVRFDERTYEVSNFGEVHGLMSNEMNLGAALRSRTGQLFFGGISGFNYFDPGEMENFEEPLGVSFTKFKLENDWLKPGGKQKILPRSIAYMDEVNLPFNQRNFTVKFMASDLANPDLVSYKYLLEGSDEKEIYLGALNEIRFNSLSPGNYLLRVYARVGNGDWTEEPATLRIHVAAPFWQKWWFLISILLILALLIRFFVRRKIDQERREQVRLELKIAERTREIRQQNIQIAAQKSLLEQEKNKVVEQQELLKKEKEKTERVLLNVIPESTARELKKHGRASARAYKRVSVLFTDFVGFTKIAERMKPTELVNRLDVYFRKFDEIIMANNLEKIKTIGDAYMCAGGVPVRNNTNPIDACLAALQIQNYMFRLKMDAIANETDYWELRLGINTGEVTAGVIGRDRLAYDIWGSTVNQAQRMEMMSEPGKVTITGNTFRYIEPYFECTYRGKAQTKSRGLIDMYVVERIKPELSVDGAGLYPNERFNQIFNLHHYSSINYYKAERHIMKVLKEGLSDKLYYHSIEHTKDVVKAVEHYALMEDVTDEGLFLLKSAATYHDAGFVENYEKNEPIGARMAEEILPKYGYSEKHIARIKELIFVTQIPHRPSNLLEEIICDADLDYLGRDDFFEISDKLRQELKEHGKIESDRQWDEIQVSFLTNHRYFTKTAIAIRQKKKMQNLQAVKDRLAANNYTS